MLIISILHYVQERFEKYRTRKQLSGLDPVQYDDIIMSNEEIRHEARKGTLLVV